MLRLADIMSTDVKAVTPEASLRELAEFLVEERVSGAPVLAGGRLVGVVSASDLLEFDSEERSIPAYRPELEGEPGDWGGSSEEEGLPSYFADLWSDAGAQVNVRLASEGPEWDALEEHDISEVMTRRVLALPPGADVREAGRLMTETGVHRLLVVDEGRLVGVVTSMDLVRAVAKHGLGA